MPVIRKITRDGNGYRLWIPKDLIKEAGLDKISYVMVEAFKDGRIEVKELNEENIRKSQSARDSARVD